MTTTAKTAVGAARRTTASAVNVTRRYVAVLGVFRGNSLGGGALATGAPAVEVWPRVDHAAAYPPDVVFGRPGQPEVDVRRSAARIAAVAHAAEQPTGLHSHTWRDPVGNRLEVRAV